MNVANEDSSFKSQSFTELLEGPFHEESLYSSDEFLVNDLGGFIFV